MKSLTLFFLLVFSQQIVAQQALEISETGSDKSRLFEENKRVKVKTITGEKYIGKFQILDANTIEIEGNNIPLNSIKNIKSRSVVAGIVGTVLIISGAYFMIISPIVALAVSSSSGIAFVFGGVVMISSGILFNEFAKNHRNTKWSYKIIDP